MKNKLIQLLIFVIFLSLLIKPHIVTYEINNAINIFITVLFPSIFPFFLISDLLIKYNFCYTLNKYLYKINNYIFHTSGSSSFVIIMSLLSGFPSGAKYIKTLINEKLLNNNEANYLITFTHFANPLFVITITNNLFNNNHISYLIIFCHIISNFIIAIIIRPKNKINNNIINYYNNESFSTNLSSSIKNSINLLLIIFGNTCFFYLLSGLITEIIPKNIFTIIINGLLDITKGIYSIPTVKLSILFKGILILTFISFGGLNIHMQVLDIIKNTDIKYSNYLFGRISQTAISIFIFYIIFIFLL